MTVTPGKEIPKRLAILVDENGEYLTLTLWGDQAKAPGWQQNEHPVIAIKNAKVVQGDRNQISSDN